MNRQNKSIYDPLIEYLDQSITVGIEDDRERWIFSGFLAVLIILVSTTVIFHLNITYIVKVLVSIWINTYFIQISLIPEDDVEGE